MWTAITACAALDPTSQPTSTETEPRKSEILEVASLSAPSPTASAVDGAVSTSVANNVSGTVQTASGSSMTSEHTSPTMEPVSLSIAADPLDTEIDCTDEANRCDPACLTAVPSSRLLLPVVGDEAYEFDLPSAAGPTYSLESYHGESNVVLVFYRAFW